jgi:adenine-specific DNA-methyltransferase
MTASMRPNQAYDLIDPSSGKSYPFNPNRVWAFIPESMNRLIEEKRVYFPVDSKKRPMQKRYKKDLLESTNPYSTLLSDVGLNTEGTKQINELLSGRVFEYSKPLSLIKTLAKQVVSKNDIVCDFFAGSSTSAQAVLEISQDIGNVNFINIQLPELTEENSEAFKAGYKTISAIGKERIKRSAKKILEENPIGAADLDLGFKVFKLDSSNIKSWDGNPDELEQSLFDSQDNIKTHRSEEDVLYEVLLKYGLNLTLPIEEKIIEGKMVFNVGLGALFICLSEGITSKVAEGIGKWKEELDPEVCRVIFKDTGFTDVDKTNSVQTLKRFGISEIKSI